MIAACSSCHTPLPDGAIYCPRCGTPTPQGATTTGAGSAPAGAADDVRRRELAEALGGDYEIRRLVGRGGFAEVWSAFDRALQRMVAVKVLHPGLAVSSPVLERFEREARAVAQLRHPGIIPIYAVGRREGLAYFVMPLVAGESLRARLSREGAPPTEEALRILREAAAALAVAHRAGIVHRDVKPENLMLEGTEARVLVVDFGIAKSAPGTGTALTSAGVVVGTPSYMSPEQAAASGEVDARSDVYALGVVAYELLSGAHPFADRTTPQALLAAHIAETPAPLGTRRSDLPPSLTALVDRCLAKEPARRPPDAGELLALLEASAPTPPRARVPRLPVAAAALTLLALAASSAWAYHRSERRRWAKEQALPEAARLAAADRGLAAYLLLQRARDVLGADSQVARALAEHSRRLTVLSTPPGATVSIADYLTPEGPWLTLGATPLPAVTIPRGYLRWRVAEPDGAVLTVAPATHDTMRFDLDAARHAPAGMVPVPATVWGNFVAFVGWVGPYRLPAFDIDRDEVTNREYQAFVDGGGYADPRYWREPFVRDGRRLRFAEAMALFRDRTGRAGPSTWEGGHFPAGDSDYPVSGVSWYEAAAYAAFAGKSLPTFAQWYDAAPPGAGRYVVQRSNISGRALAPAGRFAGLGPYGTLDMAGNAREWSASALVDGRRFILGGTWASPTYLYTEPEALPPFDRSPGNGIRCVRNGVPLGPDVTRPIRSQERDFAAYRPASDAVFDAYRVMYAYDRSPLDARVAGTPQETADWRKVKVTFAAAYGHERLAAYLFLPKRVRPPYQTVLFFPSARVLDLPGSDALGDTAFFDYVVQSGRAVLYPVYQGTYERQQHLALPGASQAFALTVRRAQDVGRALDYLDTRPDIAHDRMAYLGVSMGSAEGVIYATLQQERLKTVVLLDGGFFLDRPTPGADQADFAPRLHIPVLMVNGRYDFSFPLERSQRPLFRMLGTPAADKSAVVLDTPHDVRQDRPALVRSVLAWLDRYLGRVE
jgi:dienelactone hydrolase